MAATKQQLAVFKRYARKAHALWEHREYSWGFEVSQAAAEIESKMDAIEDHMSADQVEVMEAWACENGLFGVLGTC